MRLKKYDVFGLPGDVRPVLLAMKKQTHFERDPQSPDFYLVVGGDGAILAEKNRPEMYLKPILLVHYRRDCLKSLGFTADIGIKDLSKALNDIKSGEYTLQGEQLLKCNINQREEGIALNEVTVKPSDPAGTLLFRVAVKNKERRMELLAPKCDGILVSTKYGSPAWNLSYGGPISLDLPLMSITFIGSHIKHEHYVCDFNDTVSIHILHDSIVILDNDTHKATSGSMIDIEKSDKRVTFIHTKNTSEELSSKVIRQIEFDSKNVGEKDAD